MVAASFEGLGGSKTVCIQRMKFAINVGRINKKWHLGEETGI